MTAYHPQADGQSEKTNQTIEIVLRYVFMKNIERDFIKFLPFIEATLNNSSNDTTGMSSHEILYGFRVLKPIDLLNNEKTKLKIENDNFTTKLKNEKKIFRMKIENAINFDQIAQKIKYDLRYKSLNFNEKDKMYFRFHNDYNQSSFENRKFNKQKIGSIKVLNKINKLIYRFDISFI